MLGHDPDSTSHNSILHADHDHNKKGDVFRGMVCVDCNSGLIGTAGRHINRKFYEKEIEKFYNVEDWAPENTKKDELVVRLREPFEDHKGVIIKRFAEVAREMEICGITLMEFWENVKMKDLNVNVREKYNKEEKV